MDVTCERCGTEYEFDETLVSERGTTVKCTNCGFLFKVFPPGAGPDADGDRAWIVRRRRGGEERLANLRELQQRIAQGALDEDDELSRSGRQWKRLGDIAELQTFFRAADAARTAPDAPAEPADARKRTLFGVGAAPSVPAPPPPPSVRPPAAPPPSAAGFDPTIAAPLPNLDAPSLDAPRRDPTGPVPRPAPPSAPPRRDPTPASVRPPPPAAPPPRRDPTPASVRPPPPAAPPPRRDPTPPSAPPHDPTRRDPTPAAAPDATARPRGRTAPLGGPDAGHGAPTAPAPRGDLRTAKPALYLDEDAVQAPLPVRKSRVGLWAFLVVLVAGGIGVALQWDAIAPMLGLAPNDDALVARLDTAERELGKHTVDGYDAALREALRASAGAERDPRVLRALARIENAWAEALQLEASDLEANGDTAASTRVRAEVTRHAREAKAHAEAWVAVEPGAPAELALADALRVGGELAEARRRLDRATELASVSAPTGDLAAEFELVRSALAGEPEAAAAAAERAAEASPRSIRVQLRLARARLATHDIERARAAIAAVLATAPDHPRARALASAMDEGRPPAAPVVEVADGGVAEAPTEPAPTTEMRTEPARTEPARTEPARTEPARTEPREEARGESGAPAAGRDYSYYVRRGDQLLDSGDASGARAHFELALQQRPGGAEALTGLGYAALRAGDAAEAARHFRPAARNDYGDAYIGLADAYRRMGRDEEALQTYRAYLGSRPNGPHAPIARQQIAALEASATPMTPTPAPEPTPEPAPTPEPEPPQVEAPPAPEPAPTEP